MRHIQDHITELLRTLKALRTIRLNLDYGYKDWPTATARDPLNDDRSDNIDGADDEDGRWLYPKALLHSAREILARLGRPGGCPVLEELYLLLFNEELAEGAYRWVRFLPSRYPGTEEERVDWDEDLQRLYVLILLCMSMCSSLTTASNGILV